MNPEELSSKFWLSSVLTPKSTWYEGGCRFWTFFGKIDCGRIYTSHRHFSSFSSLPCLHELVYNFHNNHEALLKNIENLHFEHMWMHFICLQMLLQHSRLPQWNNNFQLVTILTGCGPRKKIKIGMNVFASSLGNDLNPSRKIKKLKN